MVHGTAIAPEAARRTIASHQVERLLTFDDERIRAMVAERVHLVSTNPRSVKRFINVFVFHSYVAAQRALLPLAEEALVADLGKVLDLSELVVRWPELADRLAGRADDAPTILEALDRVAAQAPEWAKTVKRLALVPSSSSTAGAAAVGTGPDARLEELREFLVRAHLSVPLMAKLV